MTVTSARIPEEDACYRMRNLCVFSRVQKGTPGLMHKRCVLQCVSLGGRSLDETKNNYEQTGPLENSFRNLYLDPGHVKLSNYLFPLIMLM